MRTGSCNRLRSDPGRVRVSHPSSSQVDTGWAPIIFSPRSWTAHPRVRHLTAPSAPPQRSWALLSQSLKQPWPQSQSQSRGIREQSLGRGPTRSWLRAQTLRLQEILGLISSACRCCDSRTWSHQVWTDCEEVPGIGHMPSDLQVARMLFEGDGIYWGGRVEYCAQDHNLNCKKV